LHPASAAALTCRASFPHRYDDVPLFRRSPQRATISALYGMIVAQARMRSFYSGYGVPDHAPAGVSSRLCCSWRVLLDRLAQGSKPRGLGLGALDHFRRDLDAKLREIGVGDLALPKAMRRMGGAFYGRAKAYKTAWPAQEDALVEALARNIYGGS
jgi:cytochrome b pre-mRNA-processing protein 3